MCGIAAIFNYRDASPVDRAEMQRYLAYMQRRGPDGQGEWYSPNDHVALGHRRLAIIDLSDSGIQPMTSTSGRSVITFNGEIYNYQELRAQLMARGHQFKSTSDTEVLLALYEEHGESMVDKLRGMFTFAIWDHTKRGLFIARDHLGIKPLYYSDNGKTFRLASQVKALLAGNAIDTAPEPAGHVGYFLWGHIPDPYTLYKNIHALPAGSSVWIDAQGPREIKTFCHLPDLFAHAEQQSSEQGAWGRERAASSKHAASGSLFPAPCSEQEEFLRETLLDSVRHHLIADVPVGVFLSAGLDSTTLAALSAEAGGNLRTVTLGFDEFRGTANDETRLAELAAEHYHADHKTIWVTKKDFQADYDRLLKAMDQPTCDGVNSFFISAAAQAAGLKVALSGLGGDELFGGYPSFWEIPPTVRSLGLFRLLPFIGSGFRRVTAGVLNRYTSPKYAGLLEYGGTYGGAYLLRRGMFMPWELPEILDPEIVREGWKELQTMALLEETTRGIASPHLRVSSLEMNWYMRHQLLRDTDWASMDHSIEIRTPLVDIDVLRRVALLLVSANPPTKHDMAGTPRPPLPAAIRSRPKTGFSVPVRDWLVQENVEMGRDRGLRGWAKLVYNEFTDFAPDQVFPKRAGASNSSARFFTRLSLAIKKPGRRILIFRIGQLGDTIVALPSIRAVRDHFPDAHLALLCDKHPKKSYVLASGLFEGTGLFDEFLYYPVTDPGEIPRPWHLISLLAAIRKARFDTLVYLAPSARTSQQMARDKRFFTSAGIKTFIGMHNLPPFPEKVPGRPLEGTMPEVDWLLSRLVKDGIPIPPPGKAVLDLHLGAVEDKNVSAWLRDLSPDGNRPWIGVGIGAKQPVNKWPVERYGEVISELIRRFDVWPVVFGGPGEQPVADQLIQGWGRGYNAAGTLGVRTAAAALKRCVLFIGNDTGTMHLASAAGVPCVGIYSSRQWPGLWEPYGVERKIFRTDIDCEGCGLSECLVRKNECINTIQPAEVIAACGQILEKKLGTRSREQGVRSTA